MIDEFQGVLTLTADPAGESEFEKAAGAKQKSSDFGLGM